jgi:hypothetical protein
MDAILKLDRRISGLVRLTGGLSVVREDTFVRAAHR